MTHLIEITKVIKKFGLHPEDIFVDQVSCLKIIRRRGYKKIQRHLNLSITLRLAHSSENSAVVIASCRIESTVHDPLRIVETFGEASPANNKFPYPVSVAQKRAEGRLTLEIAGLYEQGFLAEEEIDERVQADKRIKQIDDKAKDSVSAVEELLGKKKK